MSKLKHLENLLNNGEISRREFLARVSALGLTFSIGPALLAKKTHAGKPQKGGMLRYAIQSGATSDTLDPLQISHDMPRNINWQLRNNLVEIDHKGSAIPELAESWESTHDASQWTFKLRKNVEFHNGKTLVAEDVIFSINRHRGDQSKSPVKSFVKPILEIKADGKHAVIFKLEGGNADFPFLVADVHLSIVPAGTTDFDKGIGTGGYKLVKFEPGISCLTKRNPNYWKKGRAHFDEISTLAIGDLVARTNALRTGQIDVMATADFKTAKLLNKLPNIQVLQVKGGKHVTYPMLMDVQPYDNKDVRLALKYALDRKALVKIVLHGYGSIGNDHPLAPNMRYFASELSQREYDPDKAKFHIKKAGLQNHTFTLQDAKDLFTGSMDGTLLYKEHAAKAGIIIDVVQQPKDGYWKNVWMKKPWVACYWSPRPTEDLMFTTCYAEDSAWNDTHWKHERFNKLLKAARSELVEEKRREMYVEMQRIIRDEGGVVVPFFFDIIDAASTKIRFENLASNFELDGARCAERWWFES